MDAFILSKNLSVDTDIFDKKLREDLTLCRVIEFKAPIPPFISSPLGLVPKHDGGWRKIHHLSHPRGRSVNHYIPDGAGEMRYARFQDVLRLVIRAGRNFVIMKRDIKDAFRNIPVAPQQQWLLGFLWRSKHYKETCLSFGLSTAPLILNLFGESLHWVLLAFLCWILVHYLDEFIALFTAAQATAQRMRQERRAYTWVTDLLRIPRNDSKDREGTQLTVLVFGFGVDTTNFTARLKAPEWEAGKSNQGHCQGPCRTIRQFSWHTITWWVPVLLLAGGTARKIFYEETVGFCQAVPQIVYKSDATNNFGMGKGGSWMVEWPASRL